jgi:hypothetical protein
VAGSLNVGDTILMTAFLDQFHSIGWYQLLLSLISQKWEKAYATYDGSNTTTHKSQTWASLLITLLRKYTKTLWNHQNETIHGSTAEAAAQKQL